MSLEFFITKMSELSKEKIHFYYNMIGWLVGFYGISTFVGYFMPNPFLCK